MRKTFFITGVIFVIMIIWLLLGIGDSKLIDAKWFQYAYDCVNYTLAKNQTLFSNFPKDNEKTFPISLKEKEIVKLQKNEILVLTAQEAIALQKESKKPSGKKFLIIVNLPIEYHGKSKQEKVDFVIKVSKAAIDIGAKALIDCSASDIARLDPNAAAITKQTYKAKIIRLVIFDGGHHLASLVLEPDLLLVPVVEGADSELWIAHSYLRDAIKLIDLKQLITENQLKIQVLSFPRMSAGVKTKKAMGELARQALLAAMKGKQMLYSSDFAITDDGFGLLSNGSLFFSMVIHNEKDAEEFINKVETFIERYKPKKIELGITYGDSFDNRQYIELIQNQLSENLYKISEKSKVPIFNHTFPSSVRELYLRKIRNMVLI